MCVFYQDGTNDISKLSSYRQLLKYSLYSLIFLITLIILRSDGEQWNGNSKEIEIRKEDDEKPMIKVIKIFDTLIIESMRLLIN